MSADEAVAQKAADESNAIKTDCEKELAVAMPILREAEDALKCIKPSDISNIKALKNPPEMVRIVMEAVCILLEKKPERKMNTETNKAELLYWPTSQKILGDMKFLTYLTDYDRDNMKAEVINKVQPILKNEEKPFTKDAIKKTSEVAANIASWVIAMDSYYNVSLVVKPKQEALAIAEEKYKGIAADLKIKQDKLKLVQDKVNGLKFNLKKTQDKKQQLGE